MCDYNYVFKYAVTVLFCCRSILIQTIIECYVQGWKNPRFFFKKARLGFKFWMRQIFGYYQIIRLSCHTLRVYCDI